MKGRDSRGRFQKGGPSPNPGGRPREVAGVRELAREYTTEALSTLKTIMEDAEQPASARVAAANSLLDRGYGKAPQHISADLTHRWESVARSEFDGWLVGLFDTPADDERPLERLN